MRWTGLLIPTPRPARGIGRGRHRWPPVISADLDRLFPGPARKGHESKTTVTPAVFCTLTVSAAVYEPIPRRRRERHLAQPGRLAHVGWKRIVDAGLPHLTEKVEHVRGPQCGTPDEPAETDRLQVGTLFK